MPNKSNKGRPTVFTEDVLQKLEHGFSMGLTDREACLYAGIAPSSLYNYCNTRPDFLERKELLKDQPKIAAKIVVCKAIEEGHLATARWYLERKAKDEFSPHFEMDGSFGSPVQIINDLPPLQD